MTFRFLFTDMLCCKIQECSVITYLKFFSYLKKFFKLQRTECFSRNSRQWHRRKFLSDARTDRQTDIEQVQRNGNNYAVCKTLGQGVITESTKVDQSRVSHIAICCFGICCCCCLFVFYFNINSEFGAKKKINNILVPYNTTNQL